MWRQSTHPQNQNQKCCLSLIIATSGTLRLGQAHWEKWGLRRLARFYVSVVGWLSPIPQRYPDHVWLFCDGLECAGVRCDDRLLASRDQPLLPRNSSPGHFQYPQRRPRHLRGRPTQQPGKQRPTNIPAMLYLSLGCFVSKFL